MCSTSVDLVITHIECVIECVNLLGLLVFYVTCNDVSVICVTAQMCRRIKEEDVPTVGLLTP